MKRLNTALEIAPKLAIGLAALAALASCGLKGDLERPDPMWGDPPIDGADDPRLQEKPEPVDQEAEELDEYEGVPDDELLGGPGR